MSAYFIPDNIINNVPVNFMTGRVYAVILGEDEKDEDEKYNLVLGLVTYNNLNRNLLDRTVIQKYDATYAIEELFLEDETKEITLEREWNHFYEWVNSQNVDVIFTQEVIEKFDPDYNDFSEEEGYIDPKDGFYKFN